MLSRAPPVSASPPNPLPVAQDRDNLCEVVVHVYNNYFLANELYGIASTENAGALVEGNYFEDVPFPCFPASGYADSGPGRLVQRANIFVGSGPCEVSGTVTEPGTSYPYTMDSAGNLPGLVRAGAGAGRL